jgi:hypothetical protein
MRFALCLRQGHSIDELTAVAVGSLERVIRHAEGKHFLTAQEHPDGRLYGAKWERNYDGRPVPYAIVPLGCLPADRRGGRS